MQNEEQKAETCVFREQKPLFPGGYQLAHSRAGAILARGVVGSRNSFAGVFF